MYNARKTAENIKILCIKKNMTVTQLSQTAGVGRDLATQIRNSKITSVECFCRIADALNVPISEVVDNSDYEEN